MIKKISYIVYKILWFIDFLLHKLIKRKLLVWFSEFIEEDAYRQIKIQNSKIKLFTPNYITNHLADNFFTKEPETIEWIDKFDNANKNIFWDIGANVGLFSIYAAVKHTNLNIVSFEPSTSNLRILSRNISINNLEERIKINQFPLSNVKNKYLLFKEDKFIEGVAMHTWGENYNFEGKTFNSKNKYKIFGTSINYLLDNKILDVPNYIKIDVDGIEHLILEGASSYLKNIKIKSLSIELNENFEKQTKTVFKIMKENDFYLKHKKKNEEYEGYLNIKLSKIYNYIFQR